MPSIDDLYQEADAALERQASNGGATGVTQHQGQRESASNGRVNDHNHCADGSTQQRTSNSNGNNSSRGGNTSRTVSTSGSSGGERMTQSQCRAIRAICQRLDIDPSVLPYIGHFLRKYSIDEMSQFFQVVTGRLSLIGPRPFPGYHTEKYHAAFRALRRTVKPGISGLWQVEVRSEADVQMQEHLDTQCIENWSLWLDFYLLLKTLPAVIAGKNVH